MKRRVTLSQTAVEDLAALRRWIASEAGIATANAYVARIAERLEALRSFPGQGSTRPEIGEGIRSIVFERHRIVFYRLSGTEVLVERIIDGRRDLDELA